VFEIVNDTGHRPHERRLRAVVRQHPEFRTIAPIGGMQHVQQRLRQRALRRGGGKIIENLVQGCALLRARDVDEFKQHECDDFRPLCLCGRGRGDRDELQQGDQRR
jgi:hypothetical protein